MPTLVEAEDRGDERGALLAYLEAQRGAVRRSLLGLTEEQAARKPTAGALSLSGLLKHLVETEDGWVRTARGLKYAAERDESNWHESFQLIGDETIAGKLAEWEEVAARTERFVRAVPDFDATFALPEAPWFPRGAERSMRWLVLTLIQEVARHAGHADIIRESLDGRTAFELVDMAAGAEEDRGARKRATA
ncbi:DinB family protein [Streptomyces sp. F63]|uniref:DinB family protein n=1 Tax=Streptomyces sp. F63 TaxID=2824887 RepID=UPI001B3736B3|nr:DinB family protein [Streptomyces sp. F63]MBQ0985339.1 DinB family protein [Streptomyces sp. F63]